MENSKARKFPKFYRNDFKLLCELGIKKILRNDCRVAYSLHILTVDCSPNVMLVGRHVAFQKQHFFRESANVPKLMTKIAAQYLHHDIRGVYDLKLKKRLYQF